MKVVFFESSGIWPPHLETSLELAERHLESGDTVTFLECHASVPTCFANPDHAAYLCLRCVGARDVGMRLLGTGATRRPFIDLNVDDHRLIASLPQEFESLEQIRAIHHDNLDLGYAALSTVISHLRDPEPDLGRHAPFIHRAMVTALTAYLSMIKQLHRLQPDRVYLFNGRFALVRGALRACESQGVEYFTHERGGTLDRFALYHNTLPHDIDNLRRRISAAWEATPPDRRDALAAKFYEARAGGQTLAWRSYAADQIPGALPANWSSHRYNIVLFGSSEDEYAAIADTYRNPLYGHQREGIRRIIGDLGNEPGVAVYLRMHPNLRGLTNHSITELRQLPADRVTVIPPESDVSSYALVDAADLVISFGSTIGIEAAYRGRPSILAGRAFYEGLGSVYEPDSHEALITLAKSRPSPLPIEGAKKAGLFTYTLGEPFRHFQATGVCAGQFKGKNVRASLPVRLWSSVIKRFPTLLGRLTTAALRRRTRT